MADLNDGQLLRLLMLAKYQSVGTTYGKNGQELLEKALSQCAPVSVAAAKSKIAELAGAERLRPPSQSVFS